MSNVIQFLESLGARTTLSAANYAAAVAEMGVDDAQRQALLDRDHVTLNGLLHGRPKMLFYVNAPNDDDQEFVPDDDQDGDGVPDQDEPTPGGK